MSQLPAARPSGQPRPLSAGPLRIAALACALLVSALAVAGPVLAASPEPPRLGIRPLGASSAYFDLTLQPGARRDLTVELSNHAAAPVRARTYAADAYTIVNGGFGARLRKEPTSGPTTWLDYPSDVFELSPGGAVRRSFTVTVPDDAKPGEYIASLVIENEDAVKGSGDVALDQILRQAIAVSIRVPGGSLASLRLGPASHSFLGDRSIVAVRVANTGNIRLKPSGDYVIRHAGGDEVTAGAAAMDSVYAWTETRLELALDAALRPGRYTIDLRLSDRDRGGAAEALALPFEVPAPPAPSAPAAVAPVGALGEVVERGEIAAWLLVLALLVSLLLGILLALALVALVRRRDSRARDPREPRGAAPARPAGARDEGT